MICPICQKRKAKRHCPAKSEMICAICCGTEREVTIDCPSDCPHLVASRQHYDSRRVVDWEKMPFADQRIPESALEVHQQLFMELSYGVLECASENPSLVDSDVQAALQALAETYQTLATGIVYEKAPDHRLQRELYDRLRKIIEEHQKKTDGRLIASPYARNSEMRDFLVLLAQLAAGWANGRPKGRAFMDMLRSQFKPGTFASKAGSSLIVTP
ncbi:MAG TPA: hypothetical protein VKW70_09550 [Terriglobia bacterium]|nr:hypothetical protein [Terriglobia bacterium]